MELKKMSDQELRGLQITIGMIIDKLVSRNCIFPGDQLQLWHARKKYHKILDESAARKSRSHE